jgi:hypothetical protein
MADTVERIVFDDSQALPALKGLTDAVKSAATETEKLNKQMGTEAQKAANTAVAAEAKLNEEITKRTLSMREARAELGRQVKEFGAFGITIGGGIEKLREMREMLSLFRQGFVGSIQATETQKQGIESLTKVFGGGKGAITGFVTVMNTVRAAVLSTGIGALVIALGALITFFTRTSEGADIIQKKMAGFKAIFTVVSNSVAAVGKSLFEAFDNPKKAISDLYEAFQTNIINRFKAVPAFFGAIGSAISAAFSGDTKGATQAIKDMGQAVIQFGTGLDKAQQNKIATALGNVVDEAAKAQKRGEALWQRQDDLYNQETAQILKLAKLRAELTQKRLVSNDETLTFAKRIAAAKEAAKIEEEILKTEVSLAKQKAALLREEIALKGAQATSEDRRAAAEAQAEAYQIEAQAFGLRKKLLNEVRRLEEEEIKFYKDKIAELGKLKDAILELATDKGIVSGEQARLNLLNEQLDNITKQRDTLQALGDAFQIQTGINPFVKDLEIADALINKIKAELRQVEPLEPIGKGASSEIKALENEIERLKQIAVDFNVDTSKAQKNIQDKIKKILEQPLKSNQEPVKINLPITVNPIPEQEGFSIFAAIEDYLSDVDDAKELLNKALKDIFGDEGGQAAAEFLSSLNTGFQAYSGILQESLGLQIEANNELIKQREDQRKKLEDELDYELELQKEGLANNVGTKQEEINSLLAEEERYQKENEELKKKAARNQLIADTIQQSVSLVTASINIIKGFSNIPIVGLPLGIAAVGALLAFFAKTKAQAFAATKLHTGAKRIDDHFGFVDRYGDTDLHGGQGYKVVNARTGRDTNVRISGKEMLLKERESLLHEGFLTKFSRGYYNNIDLEALADHYGEMNTRTNSTVVQQTIVNAPKKQPMKQWVTFTDKNGKTRAKLLMIDDSMGVGSEIRFDL